MNKRTPQAMKQLKAQLLPKIKKHPIVTTLITLYALYLIGTGVILPYVLKNKLPEWIAPFPELKASVQDVRFNPFLLQLTIEGIEVDEIKVPNSATAQEPRSERFAGIGSIVANLQLSSAIHQALVLSEFSITDPYVRVTKDQRGQFLWDGWITKTEEDQPEEEPKEATQPFPVMVETFRLNKAVVDFEDFARATPFQKHIGPMDLALDNLSTLPNQEGNYQLSIALPQGDQTATFKWQGRIGIHPFFSEGNLELNQLAVHSIWEYIQDDVSFEPIDGFLAIGFDYQLLTKDQLEVTLDNGWVTLSDLAIAGKGESDAIIKLTSQQVKGLFFDLNKQQIHVEQTKTTGLSISADRLNDGQLKLANVFAPPQNTDQSEAQESAQESEPSSEKDTAQNAKQDAAPTTDSKQEWQVSVSDILLEKSEVIFTDHSTVPKAELTLNQIEGRIQNLTLTEAPADFSLSLTSLQPSKPDQKSYLKLEGAFVLPEKAVDLQIDLKDFPVSMVQPYLTPMTELSIDNLLFGINGQASFKREQLTFNGSTQVTELQLTNQAQSQAILAGQGIYLEGIEFKQSQKTLSIAEILLDEMLYPVAILSRGEAGTVTNFSQIMKETTSSDTATDQASEATADNKANPAEQQDDWLVNVGKVSIKNNKLQFSDRGIEEPVYFNIEQLNGMINQLSTKNLSKADVALAGQINGYAPFKVKGQINPLSEQAYTNVDVSMTDIALSTFSPYTKHFLNYPLVQGKFSTDLKYKLNQNELVADNSLFIDQLELGDYVESEAGLGLPLPLAISLLQTNSGEIDINLPIKGNLNDPDFKYGQVVIGALVNIITKAITSPFSLIANLAGSDADLSHLQFIPGTTELTTDSETKITQLVDALKQRQSLKLSITGHTVEADHIALKSLNWRNFVASKKLVINHQDPNYLAFLTQQNNQMMGDQTPPVDITTAAQVEQALIEKQPLQPEQLTSLAQERALTSRRLLTETGLDEKRIFIKASEVNQTLESDTTEAIGVTLEIN